MMMMTIDLLFQTIKSFWISFKLINEFYFQNICIFIENIDASIRHIYNYFPRGMFVINLSFFLLFLVFSRLHLIAIFLFSIINLLLCLSQFWQVSKTSQVRVYFHVQNFVQTRKIKILFTHLWLVKWFFITLRRKIILQGRVKLWCLKQLSNF